MRTPAFWTRKGLPSTLLLPAAALYRATARIDAAMTTPERVGVPVICVGNLVAGGAGKTPVALGIAAMLRELGYRPFFLSRGYGGKLSGPLRVEPAHTSAEVGDESLLLAACAPTIIARDRVAGARLAETQGADIIVMDDGFQNRALHKDLSLLVVDGEYRFGNERLLPAGPLREPMTEGIVRADAIIVIGGEMQADKPVFRAHLVPAPEARQLAGEKVLAFAGIGRPEKFQATLQALGCDIQGFVPFPDHHRFRPRKLEALANAAKEKEARLVTTAKDAVRLDEPWRRKVTIVPVTLQFETPDALKALLEQVAHA